MTDRPPYTPPAGSAARAILDALDALEQQYTAQVDRPDARGAEFARWAEQRQGIRAAIACARAAYADHRAG